MNYLRKIIAVLIFAFLMIGNNIAFAQNVQLPEQKIKAGLFYNFIKYSSWPDYVFLDQNSPIQICLYGGDAFNGALNPLQDKTAQMRKINIVSIKSISEIQNCHAVFIHNSQKNDLENLMNLAEQNAVLLISDIPDFSKHGGMVELSNSQDRRIHLFLNHESIHRAGLKIGNELAKLESKL